MITGGAPALRRRSSTDEAVDAGQPEIEQDEIELLARELRDPLLARLAERGLVPLVVEDLGERRADGGLVVDDEDFGHGRQSRES